MKGFLAKNFLSSNNTDNKSGSDENDDKSEIDKNDNEENNGNGEQKDIQASNNNNENNKSNEINEENNNDKCDPSMNEKNYTTNVTDEKIENDDINNDNNELENNEYKKKDNVFSSIDKMTFYECVLKQLADDNLLDSYNTLKKEINLEENANSENNFLFNLYQKRLYNNPSNVVETEETTINKLTEYNSLNKKKSHIYNNNLILNYENNSNNTRQIYSYEINSRIELIHKSKCICCANNSSRNILCSASSDSTIKMIKINDLKKKKIFLIDNKHTKKINSLKFHPTKNILFSASDDCKIQIIDINKALKKKKKLYYNQYKHMKDKNKRNDEEKNIIIQDKNPFISMYVHPCGDFLYACNKNENIIKLYDIQTLNCFMTTNKSTYHSSTINHVSGTSDGHIYGSVSVDGNIKIWDGLNSNLIHTQYNAHNGYSIQSIEFNKSNFYILTSGLDGQTKIMDMRNFKTLYTFGNGLSCISNKSIFMNNEAFIANIIQANDIFDSKFYIYNSYFGNIEHNIQNVHNDKINDIINARNGLDVHTASYDGFCKTIKINQMYSHDN
ncbi:cleavage stimulation factor subunit 1, putative [Plasmodium vinckei lentum]|uniref:Cleavage stimulation factor 50 kDa subunit n=1 Tax=Plasmodium vinckei lentum TaxID=138297 RepID=A0A6V7S9V5_PLAVN|nr:cleavage stimulation factor subunit 1, putative [Plasmodium vinckei lentum]